MTTSNKRLLKELIRLIQQQESKPLLENDYLVFFDDSNTNKVYTIIKAPLDSVYKHKFIRLNFDIPNDYPHSPPIVTFVNYDNVRIHPNMYEDGKCCSTILNTWPSVEKDGIKMESWTSSMGIETILLTFMSFLDNKPYTYEPGGRNDTSYTEYVTFQSWKTCLIRYLEASINNTIEIETTNIWYQPELFSKYIREYVLENVQNIVDTIVQQRSEFPRGYYYTRCFEIDQYYIDYQSILYYLDDYYYYLKQNNEDHHDEDDKDIKTEIQIDITIDAEIKQEQKDKCEICFDINNTIKLHCSHTFHKECLNAHIINNGKLCSLCRTSLSEHDLKLLENRKRLLSDSKDNWIINPITKRKIKIGSKTYFELIKNDIIQDIDNIGDIGNIKDV